jgi:hypothetical protein
VYAHSSSPSSAWPPRRRPMHAPQSRVLLTRLLWRWSVFGAGRAEQPPFCNFRSSPRDMADWYLKYKRTLNSYGAILLDSTLKKASAIPLHASTCFFFFFFSTHAHARTHARHPQHALIVICAWPCSA